MPDDLIEIKLEKAYPDKGFKKLFWGDKSAVMAETLHFDRYSEQMQKIIRNWMGKQK